MKTLRFLVFVALALAMVASCSNDNAPEPGTETMERTLIDFTIPAGCAMSYSRMQHDSVYVINSEADWAGIFTCASSPQIDFSTKTILVAFGGTTNGVANISKELVFEDGVWHLTVDVTLNYAAVAEGWHVVLVTDKINTQSVILKLSKHIGSEDDTQKTSEIEPVLIGKGDLSGSEGFTKQNKVIRSIEEWGNLKTALRDRATLLKETEIDFTEYQVIAIFDELHRNGGWSIDITGIVEYSDKIVARVANLKTGDLTSVMTQPYHIVRIPVSVKEILFEEQ